MQEIRQGSLVDEHGCECSEPPYILNFGRELQVWPMTRQTIEPAAVAQSVEQPICNRPIAGSSPAGCSPAERMKPAFTMSAQYIPFATLSEKALAMRKDIAAGHRAVEVCARYGVSHQTYKRAARVAASGNLTLIGAMDSGLIQPGPADGLLKCTSEEIATELDHLQLKAKQKSQKPVTAKTAPASVRIAELLSYTWTQWEGTARTIVVNSKAMPVGEEKLEEIARLCRNVRESVSRLLDKIETETHRCLQRTRE